MFLLNILCVKLLLVSAELDKHNGHSGQVKCENENNEAFNFKTNKLIFYDVNPPEGFNLRRDVYMRFAIMLSEARKREKHFDWYLVLPPWHKMFHWKSQTYRDPPRPWSMFFDIKSLSSFAPVLEMYQVMQNSARYGLKIDTLYVLQNFDDPFENGVFEEKWNIVGSCKYKGNYWGYRDVAAKQVICVQFQGSISQLWDVIKLHPEDNKVMFAHGEIPLHDTYGTKLYWDCRRSMQFSQDLTVAADIYITKEFNCYHSKGDLNTYDKKCSYYLGLHWRRGDFHRANRSTSIKGTANQVNNAIRSKSLNIKDIFVASDGSQVELELLKKEFEMYGYTAHFYVPDVDKYIDGQVAIIEQIICARSAYFIGTHESTFTYRIQEEREILGFDSDTTFNRLCPDVGECEKPSRWTIVK